jgi:hypothetical protein
MVVVIGNGYLGITSKKSRVLLSLVSCAYQGARSSSCTSSGITPRASRSCADISRFGRDLRMLLKKSAQRGGGYAAGECATLPPTCAEREPSGENRAAGIFGSLDLQREMMLVPPSVKSLYNRINARAAPAITGQFLIRPAPSPASHTDTTSIAPSDKM